MNLASLHYTLLRWRRVISWWAPIKYLRRALLWLALGPRTYRYMYDTLTVDFRTRTARWVNITIRKDGIERCYEADWCKDLARLVHPRRLDRCDDCRVPLNKGFHGQGRKGGYCVHDPHRPLGVYLLPK